MKANETVSDDARPAETEDLFEMANLFPRTDGTADDRMGQSARQRAS